MIRVLVTGMSGTGKSSVLTELARRGHQVIDTDYGDWAEEVTSTDGSGLEQVWREDRMSALLAKDRTGALFVAGCVSNQSKFYDRFDVVVLLSAPVAVLLGRIATRTTNSFGKDPAEQERILQDLDAVEPLLRATATIEIATNQSVPNVADAVEAAARRAGPSRPQGRGKVVHDASRSVIGRSVRAA